MRRYSQGEEALMDELIEQVARRIALLPALPAAEPLPRPDPGADRPLASLIDHTLLRPEATPAQIAALCDEAARLHFASVCVNPAFVALCARRLVGTPVAICTVIGFPLGATTSAARCAEAAQALADGARELDMVLAIGYLKGGELQTVAEDIHAVVATAHPAGALVKVIIETALLNEEEKITACLLAARAGADFVKTSTGFLGGGATVPDIALMRRTVGPTLGVKASGGVRSLADARALLAAGADRLGTSAGVAIIRELEGAAPVAPSATTNY
jgi:deoxyribose-phosphate aldolase